jgi:tRNA-2-methylthio-N6-dimethylallyladenosine synthase
MLKLMNRGYTAGQYYDFIARARQHMPDICLASDFIVGFPTETDDDFAATMQLVKDCRFKNSFIFKYSPRPGTVAIDRFADDVPEDVKRRRNNELLAVQQEASVANNQAMVGKTVEVLVEGESKLVSRRESTSGIELGWEKRATLASQPELRTQMVGRTRGDQVVVFDGGSSLKGQLLDVRVVRAQSLTLFGRLAEAAALSQ